MSVSLLDSFKNPVYFMSPAARSSGPPYFNSTQLQPNSDSNTSSANTMLQKGIRAPDFTLYATPDQTVSLGEFAGKKVVLVFYPADWSPVCSDQIGLYNEMQKVFHKYNATML